MVYRIVQTLPYAFYRTLLLNRLYLPCLWVVHFARNLGCCPREDRNFDTVLFHMPLAKLVIQYEYWLGDGTYAVWREVNLARTPTLWNSCWDLFFFFCSSSFQLRVECWFEDSIIHSYMVIWLIFMFFLPTVVPWKLHFRYQFHLVKWKFHFCQIEKRAQWQYQTPVSYAMIK